MASPASPVTSDESQAPTDSTQIPSADSLPARAPVALDETLGDHDSGRAHLETLATTLSSATALLAVVSLVLYMVFQAWTRFQTSDDVRRITQGVHELVR
jgi:hypothetical protein